MKKYLFFTLPILVFVSLFQSLNAISYPGFVPVGEATGGLFSVYFDNMFSGSSITDTTLDYSKGCTQPNEVVRGFTSTGLLLCIFTVSSTTTGFTGDLVGSGHYIPKYRSSGTGITNSQIYDDSGSTVTIGTGVVSSVLTRLEVLGGDIKVNGVTIGQGGLISSGPVGNIAFGISALSSNMGGFGNTAVGHWAGLAINAGDNNTFLGYYAGSGVTGSRNIAIGANAQVPNNASDDQLSIGNWIYGLGGNIGIGTNAPTAKFDINGSFRLRIPAVPGMVLTATDALGNATWQTFIAGNAYATGIIVPPGSNNYLAKFHSAGSGIVASILYESGGYIGISTSNPGAKLEVNGNTILNGNVRITGGLPSSGKALTALDASGNATWSDMVLTGGTANYIARWLTATGLTTGLIYDDGFNVGIGTSAPSARLTIDSGLPNTGGLRFTRLTAASPLYSGQNVGLGLDLSGNVVTVNKGDVIVYDGISGAAGAALSPNPNNTTKQIQYDFNKYFNIPARQSFVVTDGANPGKSAPYISSNGASSVCDWTGNFGTGVAGACPGGTFPGSPYNSFTMSARTPTANGYGYQLALAYRGDIPLMARSGKYKNTDYGSGLYIGATNTPAPWMKVFSIPVNHVEWFFIDTGYDGQWGATGTPGQVGIGTDNPSYHVELKGTEATAQTQLHIGRNIQSTVYGKPFLRFGMNGGFAVNNLQTIGFGKSSNTGELSAAEIGFLTTSIAGSTQGDIVFANRNGTTNVAPVEVMRIRSNGNVGIGTNAPSEKLQVTGTGSFYGLRVTSGATNNYVLTSDATGNGYWKAVTATTVTASGIISGSGSANYLSKFGATGTGIFASNVYEKSTASGMYIGIGTNNPRAKLEIDSGFANISGIRFTNLTTTSPLTATGMVSVGVNGSGDLVAISPVSNIAVYTALPPSSPPSPNPDFANTRISYDFNNYFAIDTKQSFVVSKGDSHGDNAPYFSENAVSANCRRAGTLTPYSPIDCEVKDPITGDYATPDNSFTMSAKGDTYGYQLALGARGDAPLFARSGKFSAGMTGGLFLSDDLTPSPWLKVLAFPANHPEYFYINTGYSSQLLTQSGGGQVAIGTTMPNSRFEIWTGSSTAPLMHFRGNGNVALGQYALNTRAGTGVVTLHSKNTAIGYSAGSGITTGSNNIFLGAETRPQAATSVNTLNIGNTIFGNNLPTSFGGTAGNIGIGTPSPAYKLSVNGTIQSADFGAAGTQNVIVGDDTFLSDVDQANTLGVYGVQNNDRATLRLGNRTGQEISTNGGDAFGIGTAPNSSYKLTVGGDLLLNSGWFRTTGTTGWYSQTYNGGWYMTDSTWIRSYNSKSLWLDTGILGSNGGLTIGYTGTSPTVGGAIIKDRVGIGTNSPTTMLHVSGSTAGVGAIRIVDGMQLAGRILVSDNNGVGMWQDAGTSSIDWHVNGNATTDPATQFIGTTDLKDLVFRTNNTEKLRITTGGNLGLGTNNPGTYKFYNMGTSYFSGNIDIRPTQFIGFQNTSTLGAKSGISWSNNSASGNALTSIYVNKDQIGKNSLVSIMDSDNNNTDEFVWIHNRTGTIMDATPMRLAANYGNFYSGAMEISNPLPGGFKQVGFGAAPGSYLGGTPRVDINGKIRIADGSQLTGKVLVSDDDGVGTWVELAASSGSLGFWKTIGNSGTTAVGNYIGTSDAVDFVVKANALEKIYVQHNTSNLRIGGDMMLGRGGGNIAGNTALGIQALQLNSAGIQNTAIGYFALRDSLSSENTAVGYEALRFNLTGGNNTAIGKQALYSNTNGWNNVAIGKQALYSNTGSADKNVAIGYQAAYGNTTGTNNIAIGYQINLPSATASNQLNIGDWIYGVGGNIGIGTSTPGAKLDVNGNTILNGTVRVTGGGPAAGRVLTASDASGNATWTNPTFTITGGTTSYVTRWTSPSTLGIGQLYDNGTNVGINTTSPGQRLDVNGSIAVQGINGHSIYDYSAADANWRIGMSNAPGFTRSLATSWTQYATFFDSAVYGFSVGANGGASSFEVTGPAGGYNAFFRGNVGLGTAAPSEKLHILGKVRIEDGSQSSGAILTSNGSGVGTWIIPTSSQMTEWVYRSNVNQPSTDDLLSNIGHLTSVPLPASAADEVYVYEVVGNYTSSDLLNGLALTLTSNCPGNTTEMNSLVNIAMGNGASYQDGFLTQGVPVKSTGVAAINTQYPFLMKGTFKLNASCKVVVSFANEINGRTITIGSGTYLIIRAIKREAPGSAV